MTTLSATQQLDLSSWNLSEIAAGTVSTHQSGKFVVTAPDGTVYTFTGDEFEDYDTHHVPHSGAITKIVIADPDGSETIANFSMDVSTFYGFANSGNTTGFEMALLSGNDTLNGTAGDDTTYGYAGNDTFNLGDGGSDTAFGAGGADLFHLGGTLDPSDHIDGGIGNDTLEISSSPADLLNDDTLTSIEKIVLDSGNSYFLMLKDGSVAAGAAMTIDGSALGVGDSLTFNGVLETSDRFVVLGGAGNDVLQGGGGNDTIDGGAGDDMLTGGGGHDTLKGGDGNDLLTGSDGHDTFNGGTGIDTARLLTDNATQGVSVDLRTQTMGNDGFGYSGTISSIESISADTRFTDTLYGNDKANYISGGNGDHLYGLGGNDHFVLDSIPAIIDGGAGTDGIDLIHSYRYVDSDDDGVAEVQYSFGGVYVNLGTHRTFDYGFQTTGQVFNIENVGGTAVYADVLIGTDTKNTLSGFGGNDDLRGMGGNDTLYGGDGYDLLRGGAGNDRLVAGDGDDYMNGGAGVDSFDGGLGLDRVSFFDVGTTQGAVVDLRTQTILNDGFGNTETMVSIERLGGGTFFADKFYGDDNWNNFVVSGGDTVYGFAGSDRFQIDAAPALIDGGADIDVIDFFTSSRYVNHGSGYVYEKTTNGVYVNLATHQIVDDGFGDSGVVLNVEWSGGSNFNDKLIGDGGDNILSGFLGDDVISGNGGNDTIYGDYGIDIITGGAGNDRMFGRDLNSTYLHDGNDILRGGAGYDTAYGGSGDDIISGGDNADTLFGEGDNDTIGGDAGDDTIFGGLGADTLTGSSGVDRFAFNAVSDSSQSAFDSITDFQSGTDKIQLWFSVTGVDPTVTATNLNHIDDAADAAHLAVGHALLANIGSRTYLVVDANGVAGYQEGEDLLVRMDHVTSIGTGDFA